MKNRQKTLYFLLGLLLTIIFALLVGSIIAANNGSGDQLTPTQPAAPTFNPSVLSTAVSATSVDPFDVDLADYHMVYLRDEAAVQADSLLSVSSLLGPSAQAVDSMEAVTQAQNLDVLVIHASARDQVDPAWIANAIRYGVVLVTIDVPMSERAAWTNSDCERAEVASRPLEMETQGDHYAYLSMVVVATDHAEDIPIIADVQMDSSCRRDGLLDYEQLQVGPYFSGGSNSKVVLNSEEDAEKLQEQIAFYLGDRAQTFYNFAHRDSPTPLPSNPFRG